MPDIISNRGVGSHRLVETRPGENAPTSYVVDAWSAAVGIGRAYMLSTGRLSLGLAGSIRTLIVNPTGSGRIVKVLGVTAFGTAAGWATVWRNPTVDLPTTARNAFRVNPLAGSAPVSSLLADVATTGAMSGGTEGPTVGVPGNVRTEVSPLGIPLAPGESLGIASSFGAAADLAATVYVSEDDL